LVISIVKVNFDLYYLINIFYSTLLIWNFDVNQKIPKFPLDAIKVDKLRMVCTTAAKKRVDA